MIKSVSHVISFEVQLLAKENIIYFSRHNVISDLYEYSLHKNLTPRSRVLLEKLTVIWIINKFPVFYKLPPQNYYYWHMTHQS
jgi:hypothetical protein